jgi:type I restriction enzyme R subunit
VIVMTDEAHRSQYDTLALNMRAALPKSRAEHTTCCCRA